MTKAKQRPADSGPALMPDSISTCFVSSIPTWGYHSEQGARLFALAPGGELPAGWSDVPHAGQHPHDAGREIEAPAEAAANAAPARRRPRRACKSGRMRQA